MNSGCRVCFRTASASAASPESPGLTSTPDGEIAIWPLRRSRSCCRFR